MNIWRAVSEHVETDLAEARATAATALAQYVEAQQTVMELESLVQLRAAMTKPANDTSVLPIGRTA